MAISIHNLVLVCVLALVLLPSCAHAFGAGNIASISAIEGKNWRHGDIEDVLKTIACIKGHKWTSMMIKRVYFGNWLRDYSQAMDTGALKKAQPETIRILVWLLSFLSFGYATAEFEVTSDRLGVYRPEEHIDNPKDYADNEDATVYDKRLRGPVRPIELQVDHETGMKNYIANSKGDWATSAAFVKYSLEKSIHHGRLYLNGHGFFKGKDEDLAEGLRFLGQALHTLEDFSAHSNYVELALRNQGFHDVFPHVGTATQIPLHGKQVFPLVTGTFGMVDFYHSVLGEATDHFTQSEVNEMDNAMQIAQSSAQSSNPLTTLIKLLSKVPGTRDLCAEAEQLQRLSNQQAREVGDTQGSSGWYTGHQGDYRGMDDNNLAGSSRAPGDWNSGQADLNFPQQPAGYNDIWNQNQHPGQQTHQEQFNPNQYPGQQAHQQQFDPNQYPGQQAHQQQFGHQQQPQQYQAYNPNPPQPQWNNQQHPQSFNMQADLNQSQHLAQWQQPPQQQSQFSQQSQYQQPHELQGSFDPQQPNPNVSPQNTPSKPLQQPQSVPAGLPGMPNFDPARTVAQIYPILAFRDKVVRTISAVIEKIPGLEALVDRITETLTVFVLSLLAPFVRPLLTALTKSLQAGSTEVVASSAHHQFEPWTDPHCTDPTHSMLSKDHFSNVLNEPAGLVAAEVVKFIAPRVLYAWQHPDVPIDQVKRDVDQIFHHPAIRDMNNEIHRSMFQAVEKWQRGRQGPDLNVILSSDGVKNGKNQIPSKDLGGNTHGQLPGIQAAQHSQQQPHGGSGGGGGMNFNVGGFNVGGLASQVMGGGGGGGHHQQQQHGGGGGGGGNIGDYLNMASKIPGMQGLGKFNKYANMMGGRRGLDESEVGGFGGEIGGSRELRDAGSGLGPGPEAWTNMPPPSGYEQYGQSGQGYEYGGEQQGQQGQQGGYYSGSGGAGGGYHHR